MGQTDMLRLPFPLLLPLLLGLMMLASGCSISYSTGVDSEQKISASSGNFEGDLDSGDQFGSTIATVGDLNSDGVTDLAVGAPFDDNGGADRGAVWVLFMDDDGEVETEQKISDDSGGFGGVLDDDDRFGSAVAPIGDLNNDGVRDIAVGAPLDDDGGTDRGAVWILFLDSDGSVESEQKISDDSGDFPGDLDDDDQFGHAVAAIGDLNGDGVNDLAVGAPNDDDGGSDRGAVWILFMNSDGTVASTQKISADSGGLNRDPEDQDHFGSALTEIGDLDSDGVVDLAVGVSGDDDGGSNRGGVWILFMNTDGSVDELKRISHTRGEFDGELNDGDQFGNALASVGDLNEDGTEDLAVGAKLSDDGGAERGAVWILFMEINGEVISATKLSDTKGGFDGELNSGDQFGSALAHLGDLNGDGISDIAVGAGLDDDGDTDSGAVWILFMDDADRDYDREEGGLFDMSQEDLDTLLNGSGG
ncbi:MAG: integrin alpha [Candidatus Thiodiazotropha sp.]